MNQVIIWYKVSKPNSVTCLKQTPIVEMCVGRCGSKNGHQEGIACLKEIGLRV